MKTSEWIAVPLTRMAAVSQADNPSSVFLGYKLTLPMENFKDFRPSPSNGSVKLYPGETGQGWQLCVMGDGRVVFCRQFDQFEFDNGWCGCPLCPYRLYMVRSVAFEELRRYALAVRNKELQGMFLSNIRTSMWLKEKDERCAQKCEKFGEILKQSVLGSLEICLPCAILLVYGEWHQQARNQAPKPHQTTQDNSKGKR